MTAKRGPAPRRGILDIAPYVPGTSALEGGCPAIKLSSNETPFGPSPRAIEAYHAAGATLSRYPDGSARPLREALSALHGIEPAQIVCGAGSDDLINLLARAYLDQLERGNGLAADRITAMRADLASAEKLSGRQRQQALRKVATQLNKEVAQATAGAPAGCGASRLREGARLVDHEPDPAPQVARAPVRERDFEHPALSKYLHRFPARQLS